MRLTDIHPNKRVPEKNVNKKVSLKNKRATRKNDDYDLVYDIVLWDDNDDDYCYDDVDNGDDGDDNNDGDYHDVREGYSTEQSFGIVVRSKKGKNGWKERGWHTKSATHTLVPAAFVIDDTKKD